MPKNWCFWTVVLKKSLDRSLGCKDTQQVHPKGNQSWVFFGRNDAKVETPVLWPPHAKSWLIGKGPDAGRGAVGEGDNRGWDGWMASRTRWTWVWVNSGRWWWTGRSGVLRFMGSQIVGHDWATELNWYRPFSAKWCLCFLINCYVVVTTKLAKATSVFKEKPFSLWSEYLLFYD